MNYKNREYANWQSYFEHQFSGKDMIIIHNSDTFKLIHIK